MLSSNLRNLEDDSNSDRTIVWPNAVAIIAAAESSMERYWAASAALSLVRKLESRQPNVVLVDLDGRDSVLSRILGVKCGESVSDILMRRTRFSKVARRPETRSFFFVPASSSVEPSHTAMTTSAWKNIAKRFKKAGAHVVLYVPEFRWRRDGPIAGFDDVIVLNGSGVEVDLRGTTATEAIHAKLPAESGSTKKDEAIAAAHAATDTDDIPVVLRRRWLRKGWRMLALRRPSSGRYHWRVAACVPAAATAWILITTGARPTVSDVVRLAPWVPGLQETVRGEASSDKTIAETAPYGSVETRGVEPSEARPDRASNAGNRPLPYAVQIAAYDRLELAVGKRDVFTAPGRGTFIVPVSTNERLYYRLLAGPFADRDRADQVQREIALGGVEPVSDAFVTETRLAYALRTFRDVISAEEAVQELLTGGIPAYAVAVSDGFRVYVGGYNEERNGAYLGAVLDSLGIRSEFVRVVGIPIPHSTTPPIYSGDDHD